MRVIFVFNSEMNENFIDTRISELQQRYNAKDSDQLELHFLGRTEKRRLGKEIKRVYESEEDVVIIFENISSYRVSPIAHGQLKDLIRKGKLEIQLGEPLMIITKDTEPAEIMKFNTMLTIMEYNATMMGNRVKESLINKNL